MTKKTIIIDRIEHTKGDFVMYKGIALMIYEIIDSIHFVAFNPYKDGALDIFNITDAHISVSFTMKEAPVDVYEIVKNGVVLTTWKDDDKSTKNKYTEADFFIDVLEATKSHRYRKTSTSFLEVSKMLIKDAVTDLSSIRFSTLSCISSSFPCLFPPFSLPFLRNRSYGEM